jgi:hypothetical protein
MALHELLKRDDCEVVSLMTSVSQQYRRISSNSLYAPTRVANALPAAQNRRYAP